MFKITNLPPGFSLTEALFRHSVNQTNVWSLGERLGAAMAHKASSRISWVKALDWAGIQIAWPKRLKGKFVKRSLEVLLADDVERFEKTGTLGKSFQSIFDGEKTYNSIRIHRNISASQISEKLIWGMIKQAKLSLPFAALGQMYLVCQVGNNTFEVPSDMVKLTLIDRAVDYFIDWLNDHILKKGDVKHHGSDVPARSVRALILYAREIKKYHAKQGKPKPIKKQSKQGEKSFSIRRRNKKQRK